MICTPRTSKSYREQYIHILEILKGLPYKRGGAPWINATLMLHDLVFFFMRYRTLGKPRHVPAIRDINAYGWSIHAQSISPDIALFELATPQTWRNPSLQMI
ncbi:hypothetical protein N7G274_000351 [Stereocaulon virgatum]|uniref:Uncharacterized protein n=1 Tax=Stereocaulon virgatum TaxID=373712 RepID=A0ABR4AUX9_9LECA